MLVEDNGQRSNPLIKCLEKPFRVAQGQPGEEEPGMGAPELRDRRVLTKADPISTLFSVALSLNPYCGLTPLTNQLNFTGP